MPYDKIIQLLTDHNIPHKIHEHGVIKTVQDAIERFHLPVDNLLKTVVFQIKNGRWILAAVRGADRIDYKKLADALATKRTKLRPISPEQVQTELGFQIGGVGPFPILDSDQLIIVFDTQAAELGTIVCGSGLNTRTIEADVQDLIQLADALTADIVR